MDITLILVDSATVTPDGKGHLKVELEGVNKDHFFEEMSAGDAVDFYGNSILDSFDEETVLSHFGIEKKED